MAEKASRAQKHITDRLREKHLRRNEFAGRDARAAAMHRPADARELAWQVLCAVFIEGAYTSLALAEAFKGAELTTPDRRLATTLVNGTVKACGTLDAYLGKLVARSLSKIEPRVLNLLRMGLYQLYFMDRVPAFAAVSECVKLAKKRCHKGVGGFVNGVLRNAIRYEENIRLTALPYKAPDAGAQEEKEWVRALSLYACHPEWLTRRFLEQFGETDALRLLTWDNEPPRMCLRANLLVTTREALLAQLEEAGCKARPSRYAPEGIILERAVSPEDLFNAAGRGAFYIQDESSMLAAHALAPRAGERVLDLCAAPGGKSTHIATLLALAERSEKLNARACGEVTACDVHPHKLGLIRGNAERLGLNNVHVCLQDGTCAREEWQEAFDAVLVDAPCSGLGVLRRRAEARWRKSEKALAQFPPLQLKLLHRAADYVKPGGRLLYSTCTIEPQENNEVAEIFLAEHSEYERLEFIHPRTGAAVTELQLLPWRDETDGFYIALFRRKERHD